MNVSQNEFWEPYTHSPSHSYLRVNDGHSQQQLNINPQDQQQLYQQLQLQNQTNNQDSHFLPHNDVTNEGLSLTTQNLIQQQQQQQLQLQQQQQQQQQFDCNEMDDAINSVLQNGSSVVSPPVQQQKQRSISSPSSTKKQRTNATSSPESENQQTLTEEELYERRKAQNRAAQRAFRERKEGKLKELSAKLSDSEKKREELLKNIEDLRKQNMMLGMENQILQKNTAAQGGNGDLMSQGSSDCGGISSCPTVNGNFSFPSKVDFVRSVIIDPEHHGATKDTIEKVIKPSLKYEVDKEEVLNISAVWDYLNEWNRKLQQERDEDGDAFDVMGVMDELKGKEKCHGYGPAYSLALVNDIVRRHLHQ
ncbi:unnamed protein product [Ambrosiozyma monospora]|uniref:Unnamed protein product n=1 Tax=Ambrosiozyma monospora TaxID=43982 RepID=A0ACB5SZV7_AMBMO|nr:unnamed protein product [Ambrosiozyma monospora]